MNKVIYCFVFISTLSSCYYDVEEELYPAENCQITSVSYTADILPVLESKCITCHNNASQLGNITLEGHANVVNYIKNGSFMGSIKHESIFSPMPKGNSKLDVCTIQKLEKWIAEGYPEN
jgi:hypothetical protein